MRILALFILLLTFSSLSFSHADSGTFYGIPIPERIDQIEVDDSPHHNLATMRFATREKPAAVEAYYREHLIVDDSIKSRRFKKTKILSFTQQGVNKMISITDYSGLADVILQSDKRGQSVQADVKLLPIE